LESTSKHTFGQYKKNRSKGDTKKGSDTSTLCRTYRLSRRACVSGPRHHLEEGREARAEQRRELRQIEGLKILELSHVVEPLPECLECIPVGVTVPRDAALREGVGQDVREHLARRAWERAELLQLLERGPATEDGRF